jgi:hypothetical protein
MSLGPLCDEIKRVHRETSCTPVLTIPSYLSLRNEFLIALGGRLVEEHAMVDGLAAPPRRDPPAVRIDWLCSGNQLWSMIVDSWTRMRAARIGAALKMDHGPQAQVQVTSTIGRPPACGETFVLGISEAHAELPTWTRRIHLVGSSASRLGLQFS